MVHNPPLAHHRNAVGHAQARRTFFTSRMPRPSPLNDDERKELRERDRWESTEAARGVRDYARDVLRLPYAVSAIPPENVRSRRVAERSGGARAEGQMHVVGLTWDRRVWPLAGGGAAR